MSDISGSVTIPAVEVERMHEEINRLRAEVKTAREDARRFEAREKIEHDEVERLWARLAALRTAIAPALEMLEENHVPPAKGQILVEPCVVCDLRRALGGEVKS